MPRDPTYVPRCVSVPICETFVPVSWSSFLLLPLASSPMNLGAPQGLPDPGLLLLWNSRWDVEGVEQLWGQLCSFLSLSCRKVPRLQDFRCVAVLGRGHFGKVALLVGRGVCRLGPAPDIRLGAPDALWPAGPLG